MCGPRSRTTRITSSPCLGFAKTQQKQKANVNFQVKQKFKYLLMSRPFRSYRKKGRPIIKKTKFGRPGGQK